jgi:D-glycero-beta-D-manno-heptose 1-phosphate adenylyltransferase
MIKNLDAKIFDLTSLVIKLNSWKDLGMQIVFTNGCFDILHYGHLKYLSDAKALGDKLVVGVNSGASVRRLKGNHRPIQDEITRKYQLAALEFVDAVIFFEEDTPLALISATIPDILVKGGDWNIDQIIGADIVLEHGGQVLNLPYIDGFSTTAIESKIRNTPY